MKKTITIGNDNYGVLVSRKKLMRKISTLASKIVKDYSDHLNPPVLLIVTNGGMYFGTILSILLQQKGLAHMVDTIRLKSYSGDEVRTEDINVISEPCLDLSDKDVIVVDDLVDEGKTLSYLHTYLNKKTPASIEYCVLAIKSHHAILDFDVEYRVLNKKLGPEWLVGFGMDSDQLYRGLDCIYSKIKEIKS